MADAIYLVAVFKMPNHNEWPKRFRTWGWYRKFEDAERAVLENHTDIFEIDYYDHAVIERMPEGVGAVSEEERWFYKATYEDCGDPAVKRLENAPEILRRTFNLTL